MDTPFKASQDQFPSSSSTHLQVHPEAQPIQEVTLVYNLESPITASSTGLSLTSVPASPTDPSAREGSVSRRRLSWGRMQRQHVDMLSDPLQVETSATASTSMAPVASGSASRNAGDGGDDFDGPDTPDEYVNPSYGFGRMGLGLGSVVGDMGATRFYGKFGDHDSVPSASESSLIPGLRSKSVQSDYNDVELDDDETHLTSALKHQSTSSTSSFDGGTKDNSATGRGADVERTPMRKSIRYTVQPSTGERLRSVKRNLRRMSLRVVNLASANLEDKARGIRLPDDDAQLPSRIREKSRAEFDEDDGEDGELPDLAARLPIRGRTLGFLRPGSRVRLTMYRFLTYSWTEPIILILIVLNAIVLTIQAARSITLPDATDSNQNPLPPPVEGYFHTWEDYALFVLFILFTVEAFARIVTTGFILDPDVPTSALYKGLFSISSFPPTVSRSHSLNSQSRLGMGSLNMSQSYSSSGSSTLANLNRSGSSSYRNGLAGRARPKLNDVFHQMRENIAKPFALAHHQNHGSLSVGTAMGMNTVGAVEHALGRQPSYSGSEKEKSGSGAGSGTSTGIVAVTVTNSSASSSVGNGFVSRNGPGYGNGHAYAYPYGNIPPPHHIPDPRDPTKNTFFSRAFRSEPIDAAGAGGINEKAKEYLGLPFRLAVYTAQDHVSRNVPYLRHSWNRIDFIAIVAFWITFVLASAGAEREAGGRHISVFRALSVLRTARLLAVTNGTTTIMRSLKRARPLLTNVAYFVLFAMILFSIIGIQSFKGSFKRSCFLQVDSGDSIQLDQRCGGYIDPVTLLETGYMTSTGSQTDTSKGYICPLGQICQETSNPNDDIQSFDTIYFSALEVLIVASANGWSPVMYEMIDAEFFVSCFFFIICILVLNFWLINLFVAVITNTFSAIRKDTQKSAFGAAPLGMVTSQDDEYGVLDGRAVVGESALKQWYDRTKWIWVLFALTSVVLQATRSADSSPEHLRVLVFGEVALTFLFDIDIIWRFLSYLPRWRDFGIHLSNWFDLILAIANTVIQLPVIRNSTVYPWLTIFQLARFYRVILEVPRMRPLLLTVFGNMYGMVNMSLFLILANYIAALVAAQLLRGDMPSSSTMNFKEIYNSFLAMYQIFSSENWTDVLFDAMTAEVPLDQSAIIAIFLSLWFLFANFILLQLFIAVINENFDVAEELKKGKQATHYYATQHVQAGPHWLRKLNPYRWFKANPKSVAVENLPSNLILPMQKAVIQDNSINPDFSASNVKRNRSFGKGHYSNKSVSALQRLFTGDRRTNDVPLATLRNVRKDSDGPQDPNDEELERHIEILATINNDAQETQDLNDVLYERRMQKADFIRSHPSYDKTFWLFSQKSKVRQFCQRLVQPANGDRIFGLPHSPFAHSIFQLVLLLTVIGGIVVEAIATPVFRKNFYAEHGQLRGSWFDKTETAFGCVFLIEFIIKLIADGFLFTPNAYIRSIWNVLDMFILLGLLVNVTTGLIFIGGLSRFTRSLKALRALRLITLIEKMRSTFQSLIISGAIRILDAAMLAILYMIPYAVWGLNIFHGLLNECNDTNVVGRSQCLNEYENSVVGDNNDFTFLAPRSWNNPSPSTTFSFDSFRSSLLILFEIVSLEGWIDAMGVATSATGVNLQPQTNNSQSNSIFFIIYIQLGAVVILTLFVSIIIGNFSSKAGLALLTKEQREWVDLKKLIQRQRPSRRPKMRPRTRLRAWCYDRAVHKHGWWSRTMTFLFIVHIIALMSQTLSQQNGAADNVRDAWFLIITLLYVVDIIVRWFGLGFRSFRANGWNIFDVVVASGAFVTTIITRLGSDGFVIQQLQKLFLVSIAFKLVQRTNSLNQLFKTAMASLPTILSLLALWFILFLFFGILYVEVFSLTKWESAETRSQNYSTLGSALVMLAFMSTGEGWNQYMHDYALVYPRCTSEDSQGYTDCGSTGWAFTLFIAWNLLSMYIFVNMFTGVVVESFSYVFQLVGGTKAITREEMRAFKKVWAEFANPRTGYLEKSRLVPFLGKLSGVFEVRIYPAEYSVKNLMAMTRVRDEDGQWSNSASSQTDGIDTVKLSRMLNGLDNSKIRKRRTLYARMYNEAMISQEPGKGISFTHMLLMLAHHKLIDDREALSLKELVTRTEINKFVNDLVDLDRVRSLLKTIYYRRQYQAQREAAHRQSLFNQNIPDIIVDDAPSTPPSTRDITTVKRDSLGFFSPGSGDGSTPPSPTPNFNPSLGQFGYAYQSPDMSLSLALETPSKRGRGLQRHRRVSDSSMLSTDLGYEYPMDSHSSRDSREIDSGEHQQILSSMQNSMWGEMMLEAAEEPEH